MTEFEKKLLALLPKIKERNQPFKIYFTLPYPAFSSKYVRNEIVRIEKFFSNVRIFRPDTLELSNTNEIKLRSALTEADILVISRFNYPYLSADIEEEFLRAKANSKLILMFSIFPIIIKNSPTDPAINYFLEVNPHIVSKIEPIGINRWYSAKIKDDFTILDEPLRIKISKTEFEDYKLVEKE